MRRATMSVEREKAVKREEWGKVVQRLQKGGRFTHDELLDLNDGALIYDEAGDVPLTRELEMRRYNFVVFDSLAQRAGLSYMLPEARALMRHTGRAERAAILEELDKQ
jgi:hypothetical protein